MDRLEQKRKQVDVAVSSLNTRHADDIGGGRLTVRTCMTPAPNCIVADSTVLDIVQLYHVKRFRHLLVTDARRKVLGVVSDRDVLPFFGAGVVPDEVRLSRITAAEIMSADVITIAANAPLSDAIELILNNGINCLPVEHEGRLVGILTSTDLYVVLQSLLSNVENPAEAALV